MSSRINEFWENTKRIVRLAQTPTRQEIWLQFKITILGLLVVGVVGYIISLIMTLISGLFPVST